ncbi:hypothetical protein DH2020_019025 [Rehmannia glutinosa]|uniref:Pentatricopeptide repeat-containing protein n=1 Tax=Rehmannia glutinosa TaxID=99300 RepID=A0ABR0WML7_REHGL
MSITCRIRLIERKPICSNAKTSTVEASLSVFTKRPFCLESPELQELSSKLTPEVIAMGGDVGLFEYRLNEMRNLVWPFDKHALTTALQCYCNAKNFDKALMVFDDLNEKGWVDQHILAILVLCYSKCGEVDMAFELIGWADKNLKIRVNEKTIYVLIHGFVREYRVDKALKLYDRMKKLGYRPDFSVYDVLIKGLCLVRDGNVDKAYHLLSMKILIQLVFKQSLMVCAMLITLDLLREMCVYGHEPWIKHYTLLVKKLCELGKAAEAYNFLTNMTKEGFLLDLIAYAATIDGFLNINKLDHSLKLFREICERGYCPDVATYNTIIKGLCKAKRITEAEDIWNDILDKGLVPLVVTYNLLIDGWCKDGDTDQAVQCFSRMIEEEQEPNVITYSTLVDGLCKAGKPDDTLNLWSEMEHKGCDTNKIAYMALINGLCKCRKPDVALIYLQKMEEEGMLPDTYIYKALIDAFASDSNTAMAHEVLEKMVKRGTASINM